MITQAQEVLLKQYKEKAFISAILAEESCYARLPASAMF